MSDVSHYFVPVAGHTKAVSVGWHDYEDGCSHKMTIHIPKDQDPESGAESFLSSYIPGLYEFESAVELPTIIQKWKIEIGPIFDNPGPGDGSDAPFDIVEFEGTREEAVVKAEELSAYWQSKTGGYSDDRGSYTTGYSLSEC